MRRLPAVILIACSLGFGCGSGATPRSDGGDGSMGSSDVQTAPDTGADGGVHVCADVPYPMALMCSVPMEICLPTSGFDCCRCLPGRGCASAYVWSCQNSDVQCPTSPPTLGDACTLPSNVQCIYCMAPAVNIACNAGKWASVAAEVACQ